MTRLKNQDSGLEKLSLAAIERRLGDISGLPEKVRKVVLKGYLEFIFSYLNMLRQKENRPADWIPETLSLDPELADGMRHFFSDYQHITREFNRINYEMDRLRALDNIRQSRLYQQAIADFLEGADKQITLC
jgi:hypothetical protein